MNRMFWPVRHAQELDIGPHLEPLVERVIRSMRYRILGTSIYCILPDSERFLSGFDLAESYYLSLDRLHTIFDGDYSTPDEIEEIAAALEKSARAFRRIARQHTAMENAR